MQENICCFFGHRTIDETEELKRGVEEVVERLITECGVDTFLFGSRSRFDSCCLETVTKIKERYPHIKRVYVRAEYPHIDEKYVAYLLESYDETDYPEKIMRAGKCVYVERNYEMVDKSKYCIVYYEGNREKSGTEISLEYARKKNREIIMFPLK